MTRIGRSKAGLAEKPQMQEGCSGNSNNLYNSPPENALAIIVVVRFPRANQWRATLKKSVIVKSVYNYTDETVEKVATVAVWLAEN